MRKFTLVALLGLWTAVGTAAETIVSQRIKSQNRLVPLKKITVGPDDQYQGVVEPNGKALIFTKKSDLVPHLCAQDLGSGEVYDLLSLSADSQEVAIAPEGLMAFTYYKFNARGDICYKPVEIPKGEVKNSPMELEDAKFPCLKPDEGERSAPFWKTNRDLGYVRRNPRNQFAQISVENLDTHETKVIAEGKIWSPAMKVGGRYLFFNELIGRRDPETGESFRRELVVLDLTTGKKKVLNFALPGLSGFPSVSEDEKYLYFSHYLNDTNFDNVIDGNDNSVVFRIPIETIWKEATSFPEQLTSAESNCSLPKPFGEDLYVTCAFEGNLDIYRLPSSGIVPTKWAEPLLKSAHQTSRSYQERVLILNTMKYRLKTLDPHAVEARLLANHLFADDTTAAKYYLQALREIAPAEKKVFYELIGLYLVGLEKKKQQPTEEEISREFRAEIGNIEARLDKLPGHARFKNILRGLLSGFLNQNSRSLEFLRKVDFAGKVDPFERYYYFELAGWVLPRVKSQPELAKVYRMMMTAPELTEESRIYYTTRFLDFVDDTQGPRPSRIEYLNQFNRDLPPSVAALVKSEAVALGIVEAKDEVGKSAAYRELDTLMSESRANYYLRKALYVRAILNFADAAEFKYLTFIATNWLRYTTNEDTEFAYAREVFLHASFDRAYDTFGQKQFELADNYFYGALSLTDDLESHYGFIRSMVARNNRKQIDERYENLKNRNFIDDNMKFVRALLALIDARPSSRKDTGHLDEAISLLKSMEQDRDSATRYLLLGYAYTDKLQRTADGYDFDRDLFEGAHRSLMLAYDLGRDNDRTKASALQNLAILHQRVQNHPLAVKFFARRKGLGFVSKEDEVRFLWLQARSLFYNNQPDRAVAAIDQALPLSPAPYLQERGAFYLQNAGEYKKAMEVYRRLLGKNQIVGDLNLARIYLSMGFCQFRLKQTEAAIATLNRSLEYSQRLSPIAKGEDRLVDFDPIRMRLNAFGMLGQIGSDAARAQAWEERAKLLVAAKDKAIYDDAPALLVQTHVQLAYLVRKTDPRRAAKHLDEALKAAEAIVDAAQPLSHALFQSIVDYLAFAVANPDLYKGKDDARIKKLVEATIAAYEKQKQPQEILARQKARIQKLWAQFKR